MRITAPAQFFNANNLTDTNAARDPRHTSFFEEQVVIDLSPCRHIEPPALLWCLTYPLVAQLRAMRVTVRMPEDPLVLEWLRQLGLPNILAAKGVVIEQTDVNHGAQGLYVVLPLTCFQRTSDADAIIAQVDESLARLGFGAPNVRPLVGLILSELALNAAEHADSAVASYGFVQFYSASATQKDRFICAVSDGGIGIRSSLAKNREFRNLPTDAIAIDRAMEVRVSSKQDTNRGIGLHWITQELARPGGRLVLHSMRGNVLIEDGKIGRGRDARLFPGTEVVAWIPA